MADISADDLKPLVYQYLVKTGLAKAAKAFAKEVGQVRARPGAVRLSPLSLSARVTVLTDLLLLLQSDTALAQSTDDIVEVYQSFCSNRCV
jgi:hypothetical protein